MVNTLAQQQTVQWILRFLCFQIWGQQQEIFIQVRCDWKSNSKLLRNTEICEIIEFIIEFELFFLLLLKNSFNIYFNLRAIVVLVDL